MNRELGEYHDQIRRNKKEGKSRCENCPLQEDNGPALIECADDYPEVVVVSESPAGRPEATRDIKHWTRCVLMSCYEKSSGDLSSARDMGYFLGRLTRGKVYLAEDPEKSHNLYWTHTMKCFIQDKDIGVGKAKEERWDAFRSGIESCAEYLDLEISLTHAKDRANPKLVIAIGHEAYNRLAKIVPKEKLCWVYHPHARKTKIEKERRLDCLRGKIKELGLKDLLLGCVDST